MSSPSYPPKPSSHSLATLSHVLPPELPWPPRFPPLPLLSSAPHCQVLPSKHPSILQGSFQMPASTSHLPEISPQHTTAP